jgi:hypothetical protein
LLKTNLKHFNNCISYVHALICLSGLTLELLCSEPESLVPMYSMHIYWFIYSDSLIFGKMYDKETFYSAEYIYFHFICKFYLLIFRKPVLSSFPWYYLKILGRTLICFKYSWQKICLIVYSFQRKHQDRLPFNISNDVNAVLYIWIYYYLVSFCIPLDWNLNVIKVYQICF